MHLGIDLGGSKIEVAVLNHDDHFILRERIPSPQNDYEKTLDAIVDLINKTENQVNARCTIGIGIPGSLHPNTGNVQNANSTWLIGNDLRSDLNTRLNRTIAIANDADCFTLSEAKDGAAAGAESVFGVILGTGVGGGICLNGKIAAGANAIRGEWGHNAMHFAHCDSENVLTCYCGKQHCIETYLSGPALVQRFNDLYSHSIKNVEDILELANDGNADASSHLHLFYERLGVALSQVINLLDPDVIVLGGGLSNIDDIYEHSPRTIKNYLFADKARNKLVKAKHGDSSGVRGAAWLGKEQTGNNN